MSKERSPAFQFYPSEYLADINTQLMTVEEEGCYLRLMCYCWREGSIPADKGALTTLCKGIQPSERVVNCFEQIDGSLVHRRLEVERKKQAEWREKSAIGGRMNKGKPKKHNKITPQKGGLTTDKADCLKGGLTLQSSTLSSLEDNSKKQNYPAREKDLAWETFRVVHLEVLQTPYSGSKADFVKLTQLRKSLGLENLQEPEAWDRTCRNYLETPQGKYTLADLCSRYPVFRKGKLDRFGKPEDQAGQEESMTEKIERWSRERKTGNGSR